MLRLGTEELSINKLLFYAVLSLMLCIGFMPVLASESDTTLTKLYNQTGAYIASPVNHTLTRISPSATPPSGSVVVVIDGNTYYYTPVSTENTSLLKVISTYGNSALITTTDESKAVYNYDGVLYTYDTNKLLKSVYSLSEVSSSSSDTIEKRVYNATSGQFETKYYKVSLNPDELGKTHISYSSDPGGSDGNIPVNVTDASTQNVYYTYDAPIGWTTETNGKTEVLVNHPDGAIATASGGVFHVLDGETASITNQIFDTCFSYVRHYFTETGPNRYAYVYGGVLYNEGSVSDITSDFIGNYVLVTHETQQSIARVSLYGGGISNFGIIDSVSGDFIGNYVYGNSFYNSGGGAIDNENKTNLTGLIGKISGNFVGNYGYSETGTSYGGAIYNHGNRGTAKISEISSNFCGNNVSGIGVGGGAIAQSALPSGNSEIGNVTGDFLGNYAVASGNSSAGGAIYNKTDYANTTTKIGDITGDFIGNYAVSSVNAGGGAIYNMATNGTSTIKNIVGDFIGNYAYVRTTMNTAITANGGAIYNSKNERGRSSLGNITGEFLDNKVYAYSYSTATAYGGAIYNTSTIGDGEGGIINSSFYGNYAMAASRGSASTAHGGAIYTSSDLRIIADDYTSTFDGNYVQAGTTTAPEAIYVDSDSATLTMTAKNNGKFVLNDQINGVDGYSLTFNGDETGVAEVNNFIKGSPNLTVDTSSMSYTTSKNGTIDNTEFNSVNVLNGATFKNVIDLDMQNKTADTITAGANSSGFITIDDINMLAVTSVSGTDPFVIQVLFAQTDDIQLKLSDEQAGKAYYMGEIGPSTEYDSVTPVTKWSDTFCKHEYSASSLYATTNIGTTDTTNDSIAITPERRGGTVVDTLLGDTLVMVSEANLSERSFTTDDAGATYDLSDDISSVSGGKLNVSGAKDENNISTLNLNNKQGFVLSNETELSFKDVKVTGADKVVNVTNSNAVVNVDGAVVDGNIDSTVEYAMNIKGDTKFNGTVSKANATMTEGTLSMKGNTFENATIDVRGGTVNLQNNAVETYKISKLASSENVNYVIDFDADAQTSDVIETSSISAGTVTVDHINLINGSSFDDIPSDLTGQTYIVQILRTQNDSLQLALSDNARQELGDGRYKIGSVINDVPDEVKEVTPWEQDYYNIYRQETIFYGKLGLATTNTVNDSIGITYVAPPEIKERTLIGSMGDTLKVVNQADLPERTFATDDYTKEFKVKEDLGETKTGVMNVTGKAETVIVPVDPDDPSSVEHSEVVRSTVDFDGHKGFELTNDDTTLNFKDVKLKGATNVVVSDKESSTVNFDNVEMVDNTYGVQSAGNVNVSGNSTIASPVELTSGNSVMTVDGTDDVTIDSRLSGVDGSKLNLANGNVSFNENARVDSLDTTMSDTSVSLAKEETFNGVNLTVDSPSSLNIANNSVGTLDLGNLKLNSNLVMSVDVDLANSSMDRLAVDIVDPDSTGKIQVNKLNLMSPTTAKTVRIPFADEDVAGYVRYTGQSKVAYSKIFKYATSYNSEDGYFTFVRGSSDNHNSYNPSVFAGQVSQLAGQYGALVETFNIAFEHSDMYMNMPRDRRKADEQKNRYAFDSVPTAGMYSPIMTRSTDRGFWLRPYAVFESVPLKNGPKVSNINYGTLFGYDTPIQRIRNGYDRVFTYYIGYNGSYQSYNHNDVVQNGGLIGMTTTLYKGNFFNATTLTAGASIANDSGKFGSSDFVSMVAGVGNKLGYNWELKQGRFIIQPYLFLGYAFVNSFDYKNGAGVKIKTAPMNDIQIAPGIKFIGNTRRGWQPYLGVQFVCNVFIQSESKANNVRLPEMYVDPYIQYGLGIQRVFQDRFTFFGQAMVRNGGRNGVSVTAGLRWILGR